MLKKLINFYFPWNRQKTLTFIPPEIINKTYGFLVMSEEKKLINLLKFAKY